MRDCSGYGEMTPEEQAQLIRDLNTSSQKAEYTFAAIQAATLLIGATIVFVQKRELKAHLCQGNLGFDLLCRAIKNYKSNHENQLE